MFSLFDWELYIYTLLLIIITKEEEKKKEFPPISHQFSHREVERNLVSTCFQLPIDQFVGVSSCFSISCIVLSSLFLILLRICPIGFCLSYFISLCTVFWCILMMIKAFSIRFFKLSLLLFMIMMICFFNLEKKG